MPDIFNSSTAGITGSFSLRLIAISLGLVALLASGSAAQKRQPVKTFVAGDTMYTMLKPGDIPAIFDPEFISVEKAKKLYHDNEPLMVVSRGGEVKAYSVWHLDGHEVVNDYLDGDAITVTW